MGELSGVQPGSTPTGDLSGQSLGRYRVGERLGGGVMAAVYRGEVDDDGGPVALKVLLPSADAVMRERFRREAATVSALDHPHIVRTMEVGEERGVAYIALEFVDGSSLADLLERLGTLTLDDACRLLAPIAEALHYAHERGIVHRDVKPSNILLRRAEVDTPGSVRVGVLAGAVVPLLSDFGIARALDAPELTSAGRTIGTPAFMAPEQCAGELDIDGRADVYALAAVLYRCLVGRPPYTGSTTQILHAHVYDPLLIPEEVAQRLPDAATALLARAMMKDRNQRFPSAQVMAQALLVCAGSVEQEFGGDDSTVTMAVLPVARTPRPSTSRVLVPATPAIPRQVAPAVRVPAVAKETAPAPDRSPAPSRNPSGRTGQVRLVLWLLGGTLAVLLALLVGMVLNTFMPGGLGLGQGETPTSVAAVPTTNLVTAPSAPGETPVAASPTGIPTVESAPGEQADVTDEPEAVETPDFDDLPPAVQVASAWENAQAFYEEEDWAAALDWLVLIRRADDDFEAEAVRAMLVDVYVRLAMAATLRGGYTAALEFLEAAMALDEGDELLAVLTAATADMSVATDTDREAARAALQTAYAQLAEASAPDDPCRALDQMTVAVRVLATRELTDRQTQLSQLCRVREDAAAVAVLGGRLVYSTQDGNAYRIFSQVIGAAAVPVVMVENAAQPSLDPNGRTLAFYSRPPAQVGLAGLDLAAGQGPAGRSATYTDFSEDARDAPPSWSPQGDRLAFGSMRFGDGRSRIYIAWADGSRANESLGLGKDPAWHPRQDLLVFNGNDNTGASPGLWLMRADGEARVRLTDNGNDQRPVWAPDGRTVVFMSNGRDGNWELYRVDTVTGIITRLTAHGAQDGLPAVSPDGRYVAFVSDRDGFWALWFVPLEGGETRRVGNMSGQPVSWLEHGMLWIQ